MKRHSVAARMQMRVSVRSSHSVRKVASSGRIDTETLIASAVIFVRQIAWDRAGNHVRVLFDPPGSEENPATIILFANARTFLLARLTSIVASWVLYAVKRYTLAFRLALLPLVNVAMGAGALVWLQLFNDGQFS